MATNTNLGGVFTTDLDGAISNAEYQSTENIGGIIFDTSIVGGLAKALGTDTVAATTFANGNVVELNNSKDMTEAGIDDAIMAGLVKYHLDACFSVNGAQRLFVSFMNSDTDKEFEAVEKMQLASGGIIDHIGIWTGKAIATKNEDGTYSVDAGNILSKLESVAESLGGKVGVTNYDGNAPLNILVSAPILNETEVDVRKLPDLSSLGFPKVSVLLGQAASDTVRKLMFAVNNVDATTKTYAPVGAIGVAIGVLSVAPANESIGHVASYDLASVMQEAELALGNLIADDKGYTSEASFTNIKTLNYNKRNSYLHKKGYIFTTNYDGLEGSVFFSCDQTLDTGDYRSLTRCRVMHKSRRVVRRALLPYVNADVEVDTTTGYLSTSTIAMFQNVVIEALDANMKEPATGTPQISGRTCSIDAEQNVLANDKIDINYTLVPRGITSEINVTEGFASTAS